MTDDQNTNITEFTALEITKFILSRILKNQDDIEKMAEELDSNERLVSKIVCFFIDTGWIRSNTNGTYIVTTKCKNALERIERVL